MDVLKEGIMVAILGLGIVFLVLLFICLILSIFGILSANEKAVANNAKTEIQKKAVPKSEPAQKQQDVIKSDDKELIAVITAAIVASENALGNNIGPDKLIVRSLRRVNSWSKETLHEQQTYHNL